MGQHLRQNGASDQSLLARDATQSIPSTRSRTRIYRVAVHGSHPAIRPPPIRRLGWKGMEPSFTEYSPLHQPPALIHTRAIINSLPTLPFILALPFRLHYLVHPPHIHALPPNIPHRDIPRPNRRCSIPSTRPLPRTPPAQRSYPRPLRARSALCLLRIPAERGVCVEGGTGGRYGPGGLWAG